MIKKLRINQIILIGITIYLLLVVEITLYYLLNDAYIVIGWEGYFAWQFLIGFGFFLIILETINSRRFRTVYSFFLMLISGIALFSVLVILSYTLLELVLSVIFGLGLLISVVLVAITKTKKIKRLNLIFIILICSYIIFSFLFYQKPFFPTLIELILIFPNSLISLVYSTQTYRSSKQFHYHLHKYLKIGLIITTILGASFLLFPVKFIQIDPKNSPEIIFWADSDSLPDNEATLQYCAEHDIGFAVVVRDYGSYIDDDAKRDIEMVLNHSVITYVALGGRDGEFYCTLDNADTFIDIFRNVRSWMISNGLYHYENFRGFIVDAETPGEIIEDLGDYSTSEKIQYFMNNLPSKRDLRKAEEDLDEFIDAIHDDEKEIGMIKLPTQYDGLDGDGDYSILTRNIYSICKNQDWDFSISMNYRTQHVPVFTDYIIEDMNKYDYTSDYELEYLDKEQLERNLVPLNTFYYEVGMEINSNELGIEDRYIFIGNFHRKFRETSYIKNKEYKKDLDICRHFSIKKVFFYEWRSFKSTYGEDEIEDLAKHNEDLHEEWVLTVSAFSLNRELFFSLGVALADRLLFIY